MFNTMVFFVQPRSNLTHGVRAYALNTNLEHGRGLGPWSTVEKLHAAVITIVTPQHHIDSVHHLYTKYALF